MPSQDLVQQYAQWEDVALSDKYRTSDGQTQNKIKRAWLNEIAPVSQPQVFQNPQARRILYQNVMQSNVPQKMPDEDRIIRPETFSPEGIARVEENPIFAKKDFEEQQALKHIWYLKTARNSPEFQEMNLEEQQAFYEKLMGRVPSFAAGLDGTRSQSGLILPFIPEENEDNFYDESKAKRGLAAAAANFSNSFISMASSLITAPLRMVAGEDSALADTLNNLEKEQAYFNYVSQDTSQLLTSFVPTLAGTAGGIMAPLTPFAAFERVFAGGIKGASKIAGISSKAGLVEKGARAVGLGKLPQISYQVTGGAIAGGIQGVSQAISEGKDWKTYIPQDMTLGVAFELLGRTVGMARATRQAARQLGMDPKSFVRAAGAIQEGKMLSPKLQEAFASNPEMRMFLPAMKKLSDNGLSVELMESAEGVKLHTDILGLQMKDTDDALQIMRNNEVIGEFKDARPQRYRDAMRFIDETDEVWEAYYKSSSGKAISEMINEAPNIEMVRSDVVPQYGRELLSRRLHEHGIWTGTSAKETAGEALDVRQARGENLGELYNIVRNKNVDTAADSFRARGILFSEDLDEHRATVEQIKAELDYLDPNKPFLIVDKQAQRALNEQNIPVFLAEHPDLRNPTQMSTIFSGKPADIRKWMTQVKRQATNAKTQTTKAAKKGQINVTEYGLNEPVEMNLKVPTESGELVDAILHFPSMRAAREAMNKGQTRGMHSMMNDIFPKRKEDAYYREAYKSFRKHIQQFDPERFNNEFLPREFLLQQARQQNYFMGAYKGKYILEDTIVTDRVVTHQFDTLRDVAQFLKQNDGRATTRSMVGPMSEGGYRRVNGENPRDPLQSEFPYEQIKQNRKFGMFANIKRKFMPTKYFMEELHKNPIMREIEADFGINPVRVFNRVQDMQRAHNAWETNMLAEGRKTVAGIKDSEMEYLFRYQEAFTDEASFRGSQLEKMGREEFEIRGDVYQEMVNNLGTQRADAIVDSSAKVTQFFDRMFKDLGLDWAMYERHYLPHLQKSFTRGEINLSNSSLNKRLDSIPEGHQKRAFMEFMREADPRDLVLNTNVRELIETYTRVAGRKMFIRPQMQAIADEMEVIRNNLKARKDLTNADWEVFVNYTRNVMDTIEGVSSEATRMGHYATKRTMEELHKSISKRMGKQAADKLVKNAERATMDMTSKFITYSVGSHLAARPYTLFRNLTQSLLTGGSLIDGRWWLEGVSALQKPGAIREIFDQGLVNARQVPVGTGEVKAGRGNIVERAIEKGMLPYMGTDWINRAVVWHGMGARVDDAIARYKAGKITREQFLRDSGARLFSKSNFNELGRILNTSRNFDRALGSYKDRIRRLAVEETQFLYNKFDQPQAFREGFGRLYGQYTSWPISYFNFVTSRLSRHSAMTPVEKMKFMGRLTTFTGAVGMGVHEAGVNPYSFYPWNMAVLGMGPYAQMLNDTMLGINGDKQAWGRAVRNMMSVIPFAYEGEGIVKAVQAFKEGNMMEGYLHLASAPPRRDLYAHREVSTDKIESALIDAGNKYIDFTQGDFYGNVKEQF